VADDRSGTLLVEDYRLRWVMYHRQALHLLREVATALRQLTSQSAEAEQTWGELEAILSRTTELLDQIDDGTDADGTVIT
jgi:hypothetical protein